MLRERPQKRQTKQNKTKNQNRTAAESYSLEVELRALRLENKPPQEGATVAFTNIFGNVLGNILNLFIAISCLGTANGLMLGCSRGIWGFPG